MKPPKAGIYTITNFIKNGNVTSSSGYQNTSTTYTVPNEAGGYVQFPVNSSTIHNAPSLRNSYMTKGHLIYGRCEQKVPSTANAADSRFEWWPNDTNTLIFAKITDGTKDNEWHLISKLLSAKTTGKNALRNFAYKTTGDTWYRKNFLMFDATAIFGAGNEPDKEWLDTNLPFFENTYELKIEDKVTIYVKKDDVWNKVKEFLIKVNGKWETANPSIKDNKTWINND